MVYVVSVPEETTKKPSDGWLMITQPCQLRFIILRLVKRLQTFMWIYLATNILPFFFIKGRDKTLNLLRNEDRVHYQREKEETERRARDRGGFLTDHHLIGSLLVID